MYHAVPAHFRLRALSKLPVFAATPQNSMHSLFCGLDDHRKIRVQRVLHKLAGPLLAAKISQHMLCVIVRNTSSHILIGFEVDTRIIYMLFSRGKMVKLMKNQGNTRVVGSIRQSGLCDGAVRQRVFA